MFLYIITAGLWSIYSMKKQYQLFKINIVITGIANFLLCPIAILIAIIKKEVK